jgi:hypothetical protein
MALSDKMIATGLYIGLMALACLAASSMSKQYNNTNSVIYSIQLYQEKEKDKGIKATHPIYLKYNSDLENKLITII